jgi:proteic killer suppression protein
MIVSFRDKLTSDFSVGKRVKAFSGFERAARLKLDRLESAIALTDLSSLPGNRFEALRGERRGQYSIRINDQWRICFTWAKGERGRPTLRLWIITRRNDEFAGHTSR